MRTDILGVGFDNVDMGDAVNMAVSLMESGKSHYAVTPNAEIVYESCNDEKLRDILNNASLVLPDGSGIILASKVLNTPLRAKVAGVEFAENFLPEIVVHGKRLFLLGGKPGVTERAADKIRTIAPGIDICGFRDGYYQNEDDLVNEMVDLKPDVVYVCLGVPKQEFWISKNIERFSNSLFIGLGGTVDIFAGETKRAPKIFLRLHLEWLYRLMKQPWRIGRMMRLPKFLFKVFLYKNSPNSR